MGAASQSAFRVLSTFLVAMACAGPLNAAQWRKIVTPRYTIITHASDHLTREMASDLDDFLGYVGKMVIIEPENLKPLTIVLFADDSEFDPFKPLTADGRNIDYVPQEREAYMGSLTGGINGWSEISMAAQDYEHQTRHAMFVGCVFWYLQAMRMPIPPAVGKGTAAVLGTFKRESEHGVIGMVPPGYARILDQWTLMPVKRLLAMNMDDAIASDNRVLFGVESWAFAHYLMFSRWPAQRHAFRLFWEALRDGATADDALVQALGPEGAADVDIDLRAYIHSSRFIMKIELGKELENRGQIAPADPMEVEIALAKASMLARRGPSAAAHGGDAVAHADAAVAAANGRPEAYDIRAEALASSKAPGPDLEKAVDDALAHGSRSAWTIFKKANFRFDKINDPAASPRETRAVIDLAEQAAHLDSRLRPSFDLVANALPFSDRVTEDDSKLMAFARTYFPSDRWILIGQSAISAKVGQAEKARQLREQALSDDPKLNPHQIPEIRKLLAQLDKTGRPGSPAGK